MYATISNIGCICGREQYLRNDGLVRAATFWTYGSPNKVCRELDHCIWLDSNKISCNKRAVKSINILVIIIVVVVVVVVVAAYVLSHNVTVFPLQQRLHERALLLRCTYIAHLVE